MHTNIYLSIHLFTYTYSHMYIDTHSVSIHVCTSTHMLSGMADGANRMRSFVQLLTLPPAILNRFVYWYVHIHNEYVQMHIHSFVCEGVWICECVLHKNMRSFKQWGSPSQFRSGSFNIFTHIYIYTHTHTHTYHTHTNTHTHTTHTRIPRDLLRFMSTSYYTHHIIFHLYTHLYHTWFLKSK